MGNENIFNDPSPTTSDVPGRTAVPGVDSGTAAAAAIPAEYGTAHLPAWVDIDTAATLLGISKLHVRLLGRDDKLKLMTTCGVTKVETSSVVSHLKEISESREAFALHACHPERLIDRATSVIGA
mgnify:FL=1